MKTSLVATLAGLALYAGWSGGAYAQFNQSSRPGWNQARAAATQNRAAALQVVTPETEAYGLTKLAGRPLRSANQEELGHVTDFLLEPQTGNVRFAVVPSGRGASGETFRLVPIEAIDPASTRDALITRIGRSQWDQVGTLTEQDLARQVSLTAEQQKRTAEQFGLSAPSGLATLELARASSLKGQPLRSGNEQLGAIDDVLIDVSSRTSAAVVAPANQFNAAGKKFVLPFERLQVGGAENQGSISTALNRAELQSALASSMSAGYGNSAFGQSFGQGVQPVTAAASAVQQALSRDQSASGVQVIPESRLVLRGSVSDEQRKIEIERAAQQAAPGVRIDNEIQVRRW